MDPSADTRTEGAIVVRRASCRGGGRGGRGWGKVKVASTPQANLRSVLCARTVLLLALEAMEFQRPSGERLLSSMRGKVEPNLWECIGSLRKTWQKYHKTLRSKGYRSSGVSRRVYWRWLLPSLSFLKVICFSGQFMVSHSFPVAICIAHVFCVALFIVASRLDISSVMPDVLASLALSVCTAVVVWSEPPDIYHTLFGVYSVAFPLNVSALAKLR